MIEVYISDRLGKKIKVMCNPGDTVRDLKILAALSLGVRPEKLRLQKWHKVFADNVTLNDYEIMDGMNIELFYI
eukprot:gnl/Chilomastix_caulleri/3072.p1 GENE.gnl/Chilomastix_caulleri/3072~~gnl/Chilomastix_caulleri/3072.p1  ORF type:complete len:74 (+),score=3.26 gnl/Chilomastix_caulleri/3072:83-304(+)